MLKISFIVGLILCNTSMYSQLKVMKIEIKYVNPYIETFIRVKCDSFEKSFNKKQVHISVINDSTVLDDFSEIFKRITFSNGKKDIDVRRKFYFSSNNNKYPQIICMDRFNNILVDGRPVKKNKKLIRLLRSCLR